MVSYYFDLEPKVKKPKGRTVCSETFGVLSIFAIRYALTSGTAVQEIEDMILLNMDRISGRFTVVYRYDCNKLAREAYSPNALNAWKRELAIRETAEQLRAAYQPGEIELSDRQVNLLLYCAGQYAKRCLKMEVRECIAEYCTRCRKESGIHE